MNNYHRLITISLLEKFAFNGLKPILVLYAIKFLLLDSARAIECIGAALGIGFITPLLGGFLATWVSHPKSVIIAGLGLVVCSTACLGLSHGTHIENFYLLLSMMVLGAGFIRSNLPALLSSYQVKDKNLYTKYYIYINIGSLIGTICCSIVAETYGWSIGFSIAAFANLIALLLSFTIENPNYQLKTNSKHYIKLALCLIILVAIAYNAVTNVKFYNTINISLLLIASGYIGFEFVVKKSLSKRNFYTFLILAISHFVYLALYEQGIFSITLFTEKFVDRQIPDCLQSLNLMNWEVLPVSSFQMIDPFFNALIGTLMVAIWKYFERQGKVVDSYIKFIIGLFMITCAYLFLYFIIQNGASINFTYIVILYVFFVLSELTIIPTAMTFVSQMAPKEKKPIFMGLWFMGMGFSQWLALNLAKIATTPNSDQTCVSIINYKHCFLMFAYMALGVMGALVIAKLIDSIYFKKVAKRSD